MTMRNATVYLFLGGLAIITAAALCAAQEAPAFGTPLRAGPGDTSPASDPPQAVTLGGAAARAEDDSTEQLQRRIRDLKRHARSNFERGRLGEARRNIIDLINAQPYVAGSHLALALVLRSEGRQEEHFRKLKDVLDLNGPEQIVHLLIAEHHMQKGERREAFAALRQAAEAGLKLTEAVTHLPHLRHLRHDTDFVELALTLEKYALQYTQKRDPFVPGPEWMPLQEDKPAGAGVAPSEVAVLTQAMQAELLMRANSAMAAIRTHLNAPQPDEQKIMEHYRELEGIIAQGQRLTLPRFRHELTLIADRLGEIETQLQEVRLKDYYEQLRAKLADMRKAFEDNDWNQVEDLHKSVKTVADAMTAANPRFKLVADQVMANADRWRHRAVVRREFAEKDTRILGIVTSDESGGNYVIINNRLLRVGDRSGDFQIDAIEHNRVVFLYKGEKIGSVFRRY